MSRLIATVGELIEALKELPEDMHVVVPNLDPGSTALMPIRDISIARLVFDYAEGDDIDPTSEEWYIPAHLAAQDQMNNALPTPTPEPHDLHRVVVLSPSGLRLMQWMSPDPASNREPGQF
jgi:hypothetical protein